MFLWLSKNTWLNFIFIQYICNRFLNKFDLLLVVKTRFQFVNLLVSHKIDAIIVNFVIAEIMKCWWCLVAQINNDYPIFPKTRTFLCCSLLGNFVYTNFFFFLFIYILFFGYHFMVIFSFFFIPTSFICNMMCNEIP